MTTWISFRTNQSYNTVSLQVLLLVPLPDLNVAGLLFHSLAPFPVIHRHLLVSVSLRYVYPLTQFPLLCLYVSIRRALMLGGPWEAPSFLSNSFIRSPAVSCQGLSLLLVSEGRTGRVQHVGTRSQLLRWCCRSPRSFETWGKIWPYHSSCFCLFICLSLKGVMCKIKKMWRKAVKHGGSMEENVSVLLSKLFRSR